jgi:hypothetical protein
MTKQPGYHTTITSKVEVLKYDRDELSTSRESDFALVETRLEERFSGGLAGSGHATHLRLEHANGTGRLICFERFEGRVGERSGSFVLQASGYTDAMHFVHGSWEVVEESGTGDLVGLRGFAVFSAHPSESSRTGWEAETTFTYWFGVEPA